MTSKRHISEVVGDFHKIVSDAFDLMIKEVAEIGVSDYKSKEHWSFNVSRASSGLKGVRGNFENSLKIRVDD